MRRRKKTRRDRENNGTGQDKTRTGHDRTG